MFLARIVGLVILCLGTARIAAAEAAFALRTNDVVAFAGGSDVAAAQFTGHLEALFAVSFPGAGFRNFGWEGDTVFAQPREIGFPSLTEHLKHAGATVLVVEFGRAEALSGKRSVAEFIAAYEKFLNACAKQTPRLVIVIPPPFESASEPLPDLSRRNRELAAHAEAIRSLAN